MSLLRASHGTECTFLTLSFSILDTHSQPMASLFPHKPPGIAVTHSPSEPHSWRAVASSARLNHRRRTLLPHFSSPLLFQTPPPPTLFLSRFVSLTSLFFLCENFMIQLMTDEFLLIACSCLSKTATTYPETAACKYSECVCVCERVFNIRYLQITHYSQLNIVVCACVHKCMLGCKNMLHIVQKIMFFSWIFVLFYIF